MPFLQSCSLCYDLKLEKLPKLYKDPYAYSIGQVPRYWIRSQELRSSAVKAKRGRGCRTCRMLRDAIDTLISQGGLTDMGSILPPKTRELEYQIAILDGENHNAYKNEKKEGRKGRAGSQSLRLKLRCNVDGGYWDSQGRGFMEEFDVELFTPPDGMLLLNLPSFEPLSLSP